MSVGAIVGLIATLAGTAWPCPWVRDFASALPQWLGELPAVCVIVVSGENGSVVMERGAAAAVGVGATPSAGWPRAVLALAVAGDEEKSESRLRRARRERERERERAEPKAWLGVMLTEVPKMLDKHLRLDGKGIMVLNVAEDSPAAEAGLEQYDVIVEVNGEDLDGDVQEFREEVAEAGPGGEVTLTVIHEGREKEVRVVLGERPRGKIEWVYESGPALELETRMTPLGRFLRRGPGGKWELGPGGEWEFRFEGPGDLPPFLREHWPGRWHHVLRFRGDDDFDTVVITNVRDGESLTIERKRSGEIRVRRSRDGEDVEEKVYDSVEELREADPEAADALEDVLEGLEAEEEEDEEMEHFPGAGLDIEALRRELAERFGEHREEYERALREAEEAMRRARRQMGRLPEGPWWPGVTRGPRYRFEVGEDGRITVHIRRGDSEATLTFDNEEDLREDRPDLYRRYERLMEEQEDSDER